MLELRVSFRLKENILVCRFRSILPTNNKYTSRKIYISVSHHDAGVVENGGIINKIGTYSLGIVAKEFGKPFYVAAESFKFARLYPLNQSDLPTLGEHMNNYLNFVDTASWLATGGIVGNDPSSDTLSVDHENDIAIPGLVQLPQDVKVNNPLCDYTPAKYITLLFTDLGVLTPSAVSDELIRLYQ